MSYPTADEARMYAYQYDADGTQGRVSDDELFPLLVTRASRLFDALCNRPAEYFAVANLEGSAPATDDRVFYGDGTNYLLVDPHAQPITADDVEMPETYTVSNFVDKDGYLILTDSRGRLAGGFGYGYSYEHGYAYGWTGWPDGCPVTVTSIWGFAEDQEDVKEAILELIIAMWRSKDSAFLKAIDLENQQVINEALPKRTKEVIQIRRFFDKALVA